MIGFLKWFANRMSWTNLIRQAALFIFLLQFIKWFQHYWFEDTYEVARITLIVVFVIQVIIFRMAWLRYLLQFIGAMVTTLIVIDWYPYQLLWDEELSRWDNVLVFLEQFHPFVWFAISVWLIYALVNILLNTRERVFVAVVLSVIALAVADSYTSIYLWEETAFVVISGLILMVNRHFDEFREKHPHTWKYITEYPWGITFTAAALVGFIGLMSVIAPNVRPLLVDPYTAWHQLQGRTINLNVKEDTQAAVASFLALHGGISVSGYGRDDSRLGGGFYFNYEPVFEVRSPVRSYWRGEAKSIYTGQGWISSHDFPDLRVYGIGEYMDIDYPLGKEVEQRQFTQSIRMLSDHNPEKIFGAYPIVGISSLNGSSNERSAFFGKDFRDGSVQLLTTGISVDSYSVVSAVTIAKEEDLKKASIPEIDESMIEYIQVPENLPERVYQLVDEITAGYETPFEKVKAIEQYLRNNYTYNNTPDESRGKSHDFVDRFLFEILEGYCDYFSTSMAVMVRTLGIPTRWVKGYASGDLDESSVRLLEDYYQQSGNSGSNPEIDLTYVVRNSDAHSWVEVYFEGYGWIMFEPTAGFVAPSFALSNEAEGNTVQSATPNQQVDGRDAGAYVLRYIVIIVSGALVLIAVIMMWMYRRTLTAVSWKRLLYRLGLGRKRYTPNEQIIEEFNRLLRYVNRKGLVREEHQTAREVVHEWGRKFRSTNDTWQKVLHDFELAKYGMHKFTAEDVAEYQKKLRELKRYFKDIA